VNEELSVIILAAGKGTRMKSELPKVLHPLCGRPMLSYALDAARALEPEQIIVVVGFRHELVREAFGDELTYALQEPQLGTGHAVQVAAPLLAGFTGDVLVTYGDMPLLRGETLERVRAARREAGAAGAALTAVLDDPPAYGRVVRDAASDFVRIVEDRDCTPAERAIREVNLGVYAFAGAPLARALGDLRADNAQGEYYLTDVPALLVARGERVVTHQLTDLDEAAGVNDVEALHHVEGVLARASR
jgi:UDP-N-acetylglucosamine diphosphorylase/glucosamine-1-phosphate N-acetyltransferase